MTNDNRYNGWANRETWLVGLWFDLDAELTDEIRDAILTDPEDKQTAAYSVAESVETYIDQYLAMVIDSSGGVDILTTGFVGDLFSGAKSLIDYQEIATHLVDNVWDEIQEELAEDIDAP